MMAIVSTSPEYDEAATGFTEEAAAGGRHQGPALPLLHPRHRPGRLRPAQGEPGAARAGQHQVGRAGQGLFPREPVQRHHPQPQHHRRAACRTWWMPRPGRCWPTSTWTTWSGSAPCRPPSGVYHNTQMEENGWTALGPRLRPPAPAPPPAGRSLGPACRRWMFCTATMPQDSFNQTRYRRRQDRGRICAPASTPRFPTAWPRTTASSTRATCRRA